MRAGIGGALLLVATSSAARADEARALERLERPGLALQAGFGPLRWGVIGGALSYQVPFRLTRGPLFWWAPWAAAGLASGAGANALAATGGLSVGVGWRHRLVADAGAGRTSAEALVLHGRSVAGRSVLGLVFGAGYEYVGVSGFMFRFVLGLRVPLDGYTSETSAKDGGELALGWRF